MSSVFPYKSAVVVTCFPQQSPWLVKELESLDYDVQSQNISEVEISGYMDDCMRLNMYLRTANRVLFQIQRFRANNANELYKKIKAIPWEKYLDNDGYISITSYVRNESITDDRFANVRVKDAIADRMIEVTGKRPNSGPDRDKTVIHLYWKDDKVRIYFDTSGQTISKHGYRQIPFKAPMIESLAASTIIASGWDKKSTFVNPMCGSGTLAIEAALMAINKAPGLMRDNFGFMHIKGYDEDGWKGYQRLAGLQVKEAPDFKIVASDLSKNALWAANQNAKKAGVSNLIEFHLCDFRKTPIPIEVGTLMMNPEYGERLGADKDLEAHYAEIGDFFKKSCQGYTGFVFTGNLNLAKRIGLRTSARTPFFNGRIECRLLKYELYQGTKKRQD
ncbi:THUMP domain-containing class I SAM-dependent RNA methyltransferase [Roseivirga misakiensis]|uniref:RNA methyltransferase n=1 Tax=Roseivirga misakiensis TaxID=1563681 RepID=A0A1E5SKQ1_9BACT|nr:RNA methyltransferase [Roseivirga misakiensis]OEJ99708.1 RNA methyltransferase [Roseivirga misakiensis]